MNPHQFFGSKLGVSLGIFALLSGALITFFIIYTKDDQLRAEIETLLNIEVDVIPVQENGFYYLAGLYAPFEKAPLIHGIELMAEAERQVKETGIAPPISASQLPDRVHLSLQGEKTNLCEFSDDRKCLDFIRENREFYHSILGENRVLINRYRKLIKFSEFSDSPVVDFSENILTLHRLFLSELATQWLDDQNINALTLLQEDYSFWRHVAVKNVSLITRMIATAAMGSDLRLMSELLTDCRQCVNSDHIASMISMPFTMEERSFRYQAAREMQFMVDTANAVAEGDDIEQGFFQKLAVKLFFKKNDFLNKCHEIYDDSLMLGTCPEGHFEDCISNVKRKAKERENYLGPGFLKNPVGNILVAIAQPRYYAYPLHLISLEGYRRLLVLKIAIMDAQIDENDITDFLANQDNKLRNPFNQMPMNWDADARSLFFEQPEPETNERIFVTM